MKRIRIVLIAFIIIIFMSGCSTSRGVPTYKEAQRTFKENQAYVSLVVEYMCNTQYESIYISESNGIMLADLNHVKIEDSSVADIVRVLLESQTYEYISKRGNTIYFPMGHNFHECSSGIALSIDENRIPDVQYMTECISLEYPGWYYYVADYNLWRVEHN